MSNFAQALLRGWYPRRLTAVFLLLAFLCAAPAESQQNGGGANSSNAGTASSDPLLRAMREELDRSKAQLKMENVPAPYYIEYRLSDVDQYEAEAAFGALRQEQRLHARTVHVVVRVGDYKQDSYIARGMGAVNFAPMDDDPIALRWQLWSATDQAYKAASEALAQKRAALRQFTADQPFDDFAHAPAVQSIEPLVKLQFDPKPWKDALEKSSDLFRTDPKIQSLSTVARFRAVNQYLVNTEGTVTRHGYASYFLTVQASTQAADGMRLDRSPYFTAAVPKELPTPEQFQAAVAQTVETLKTLRDAPVVDEDYRGPVLFSPDAAADVFTGLVGGNVLGNRPRPGDSARTTGDYASNYKSRVLPTFLSVEDDPTKTTFGGKTLIGSYDLDDEGVRAAKVSVIEDGQLMNYLMDRQPIRDFPESNGHGRAAPGQITTPSLGNLFIESKQALSPEALRQKLIEICKQEGKEFGYFVETMGGTGLEPRLLYRVYVKDGHEELVRGAAFDELDTRALRNDLVAAGNDAVADNRDGTIPTSVVTPSILFDDMEVKRTDTKNAKLPEYPPPDLTSAAR